MKNRFAPNGQKIAEKEELNRWLDDLSKEYVVYTPMKKDELVSFERYTPVQEVLFDFSNSIRTPKEFFFPQSEVLFTFQSPDEGAEQQNQLAEHQIIFGIRPCDARDLLLLDKVFKQDDFQDPYYAERRDNTILIGVGCEHPQATCFCTSVGGSPFDKVGLDIILTKLDDNKYFLESLTEKGENLIGEEGRFKDADENEIQEAARVKKEAEDSIKSKASIEGLKEKLDNMFDSPLWDEIHQKCLGCAVCTYLCPTCHCFALLDEKVDLKGERIRNWDSCMFSVFTLEASGHNPRISNKERMRQRIMHKFNYFVTNFGEVACVGCGRCIRNCPVNMDIREIIEILGSGYQEQEPNAG